MKLVDRLNPLTWSVGKIAVVGAGIVGVPMAAVLAHGRIYQGSNRPAQVVIIQRDSPTSGWKVNAINSGKSPLGGIEPYLEGLIAESVSEGLLVASHDYRNLRNADVILICVQTDKIDFRPDYGPMFEALSNISKELQKKTDKKIPLVILESTLAPSSMLTIIKEHFAKYGLMDGQDILLGNSPNRIMSGHLVERITSSDKVIGGLHPKTPELIHTLYSKIVTSGKLHLTNSMTAEIVKTLENAYRDIRIAYSAEIARFCDAHDIDFYQVREEINRRLSWSDTASEDPSAVPTGGLLIPTVGVGGHCLPKDGVLLLWRQLESGQDMSGSLILEARRINDESPQEVVNRLEERLGELSGKSVTMMGTAYRFNSGDTRNSPSIVLAQKLLGKGCHVTLHDPFVKPNDQNLIKSGLDKYFTNSLKEAMDSAEILIFCTTHPIYTGKLVSLIHLASQLEILFDGCNLFKRSDFAGKSFDFLGIGKGLKKPPDKWLNFVYKGFKIIEIGISNEIQRFINFANQRYARDNFDLVDFKEVQRIVGTCATGCKIISPGPVERVPIYRGFISRLVKCAQKVSSKNRADNS